MPKSTNITTIAQSGRGKVWIIKISCYQCQRYTPCNSNAKEIFILSTPHRLQVSNFTICLQLLYLSIGCSQIWNDCLTMVNLLFPSFFSETVQKFTSSQRNTQLCIFQQLIFVMLTSLWIQFLASCLIMLGTVCLNLSF